MSETRLAYRFGPLERRGILGPLRAAQAAVLVLGAAIAVAALDLWANGPGLLLAFVAVVLAGAGALVPFGGRTAAEWVPIVTAFVWRSRHVGRFRSSLPTGGRSRRSADPHAAEPAWPLTGVLIRNASAGGRTIGTLSERGGRRLTALLACRVTAFALLDPEAQERRLHRWGIVLSGAAGTAVRRLGWIERTAPGEGDALARWLHAERDPAVPPRGTAMIDSYLELIGQSAALTQAHEVLLAVQVDAARVRDRGRGAIERALIEETERVAHGLEAAEVSVLGALGPAQLAQVCRTAYDPFARAELAALTTADPERAGLDEAAAWPMGAEEGWERYRSDGALHTTYWIAGWPRVEVSPMFMDALLGRSSAVRTVAVTFEPLLPERSTREVEAAITRDRADRELRHRFGQSETARHRQAQESTARREAELASGHGEVRFAGFITVSGRDDEDLRRARAEVLDHAARARLELRCLYGQQADAFTFTLPLCRGLR